ncbi:unnamed protein product [Miscanthus lutarioriparius]|uniref:Uncharacterized protein n=1 Tax=Miscanthus lutarioriparius TaxID=422564 RepID=A0A811RQT8_9POAL|nr:unnamed protein product [Miscanthus lutarioriparius]
MWRRGAPVVADGEVHVERVEKIVILNGIPWSPPPLPPTMVVTSTTRGGVIQPSPPPPAGQHGKERDINELAEEFIRRNRAAF